MTDKEIEHSHNNFVETLQDEQAIIPQIWLVQSSSIPEQNTSNDVLCKEKNIKDNLNLASLKLLKKLLLGHL